MATVGHANEEALKRKERLKALRQKQAAKCDEGPENKRLATEDDLDSVPRPVFRSYKPQDEKLKENILTDAKPGDVTERVQKQLESAKETNNVMEEVDLINLAPRKPDWDLKRDVAKKLAKLEKRTQRAIAELIRERLQSGKEDLATVVNASAAVAEVADDDDDDDDDD